MRTSCLLNEPSPFNRMDCIVCRLASRIALKILFVHKYNRMGLDRTSEIILVLGDDEKAMFVIETRRIFMRCKSNGCFYLSYRI